MKNWLELTPLERTIIVHNAPDQTWPDTTENIIKQLGYTPDIHKGTDIPMSSLYRQGNMFALLVVQDGQPITGVGTFTPLGISPTRLLNCHYDIRAARNQHYRDCAYIKDRDHKSDIEALTLQAV